MALAAPVPDTMITNSGSSFPTMSTFTRQIFSGMILSTCGCLTKSRDEMRRLIERHGGKSVAKTSRQVAMLITTVQDAHDCAKVSVKNARRFGIPIVTEQYVLDCIRLQECLDTAPYEISVEGSPPTTTSSSSVVWPSNSDADDESDLESADDSSNPSLNEVDHEPTRFVRQFSMQSKDQANTVDSFDTEIAELYESLPVPEMEHIADKAEDGDDQSIVPESTPSKPKKTRAPRGVLKPKNIFGGQLLPPPPTPPRSNTPTPRKSARMMAKCDENEAFESNGDLPDPPLKNGHVISALAKKRGRPPKRGNAQLTMAKRSRISDSSDEAIDKENIEEDLEMEAFAAKVVENLTVYLNKKQSGVQPQKVRLRHRRRFAHNAELAQSDIDTKPSFVISALNCQSAGDQF